MTFHRCKRNPSIYSLSSSQLFYFGKIKQSTGEDWNDACLSLSTAMPSVGGTPPELEMLHVYSIGHYQKSKRKQFRTNSFRDRGGSSLYDDVSESKEFEG